MRKPTIQYYSSILASNLQSTDGNPIKAKDKSMKLSATPHEQTIYRMTATPRSELPIYVTNWEAYQWFSKLRSYVNR